MKKLAMIGCGCIGSYHLEHFLKYEDIELSAFCDIIPERAESFAKKAGGKAYTCFKQMYDEIKPDMVFICVPPAEHGEIEFEAIDRGIHLFVEKPVALDMNLAQEIRDRAKEAGIITAVGFQCRYSSITEVAREFTGKNEIVHISCNRIGGIPEAPWWKKRALSGGQIAEQTIHQLDLIRYVYGEPKTVLTMGTTGYVKNVAGYETEDLTSTVIKFQGGALGVISTGCYATEAGAAHNSLSLGSKDSRAEIYLLSKLELYGANNLDKSDKPDNSGLVIKGDGAMTSDAGFTTYKEEVNAGDLCDRTFIDAVIRGDGSKILSPYEDAVRSLAFALACNKSLDTGLPVEVELNL